MNFFANFLYQFAKFFTSALNSQQLVAQSAQHTSKYWDDVGNELEVTLTFGQRFKKGL